jgi:hypothetical protein
MRNLPTIIFWAIIIFSVVRSFAKQKKQTQNSPPNDIDSQNPGRIKYKVPDALDMFLDAQNIFSPSDSTRPTARIQVQQNQPTESKPKVATPTIQEVIPANIYEIPPAPDQNLNTLLRDIRTTLSQKSNLQQAFLLNEILQKPKALRHRIHG